MELFTKTANNFPAEADERLEAENLINEFCMKEYGRKADFGNPERIDIAYTTTEYGCHELQAVINLSVFSISLFYDGKCIRENRYGNMKEFIDMELSGLDFDTVLRL